MLDEVILFNGGFGPVFMEGYVIEHSGFIFKKAMFKIIK